MKEKEAFLIRQVEQNPKHQDPNYLEIQIKCPEPENIAAEINYHVENKQPVVRLPSIVSKPAQSVQKEGFQIPYIDLNNFSKNFKLS